MNRTSRLAEISEILADHLGKALPALGPDTQFNRDFGLDSLHLKIEDGAFDEIVSLGDLLHVIELAEETPSDDG